MINLNGNVQLLISISPLAEDEPQDEETVQQTEEPLVEPAVVYVQSNETLPEEQQESNNVISEETAIAKTEELTGKFKNESQFECYILNFSFFFS